MGSFPEAYHLQTFIWFISLCPAPTIQTSVKFRDFDRSLSNLAILLILRRSSSCGVDGFSVICQCQKLKKTVKWSISGRKSVKRGNGRWKIINK